MNKNYITIKIKTDEPCEDPDIIAGFHLISKPPGSNPIFASLTRVKTLGTINGKTYSSEWTIQMNSILVDGLYIIEINNGATKDIAGNANNLKVNAFKIQRYTVNPIITIVTSPEVIHTGITNLNEITW